LSHRSSVSERRQTINPLTLLSLHNNMFHPHEYLLKEYQHAINHLAPTVPANVKNEAQAMHDQLLADPNAAEKSIGAALVKTGLAEYPYRHAFQDLTRTTRLEKVKESVLDHVEEETKRKLEEILASGANIEEAVNSKFLENNFSPEERNQIECGLIDAEEHVKEEMKDLEEKDKTNYGNLVKKYETQREEIQKQINLLRAMASHDKKWEAEILDKVKTFEEGWSVTEKDPDLDTVKKEIEYWQGVFGEE